MAKKKHAGERYIQIKQTVFESVAFRTLPGSAAKLYLDLRVQYYGSNNGTLLLTPKVMERRDWNSPAKLIRARNHLLDRGLIKYTRQSGPNTFHRASLFAFTDLDVPRNDALCIHGGKATHDYLQWTPRAMAKRALPNRNGSMYRNGSETAPESVGRGPETASESVDRQIGREAAPVLALAPIAA